MSTPIDYLNSAKKHLEFCKSWEEKTQDNAMKEGDLLEIYYLLGYVAECLTVYTIYRFGSWAPNGDYRKNIRLKKFDIAKYYDPLFTLETDYDFYHPSTRSPYTHTCTDRYQFRDKEGNPIPQRHIAKNCEIGETWKYCTQHHKFKDAIENVIVAKLLKNSALSNVDFYSNYNNNKNGDMRLLKKWDTALRYCPNKKSWVEHVNDTENLLNETNVRGLIKSLDELYRQLDKIH